MFTSFTGSSRRPRQVNLSNRSLANPFTAHPPSKRHPASGPQATLAIAQQERLQRQLDRDKLRATQVIQRTWRGYRSRKATRFTWRQKWDQAESKRDPHYRPVNSVAEICSLPPVVGYRDSIECIGQLKTLLAFMEIDNEGDLLRLCRLARAFQEASEEITLQLKEYPVLLTRLMLSTLHALSARRDRRFEYALNDMLQLLIFLTTLIPRQMSQHAHEFYLTMARLTTYSQKFTDMSVIRSVVQTVLALLQPITSNTLEVYEWFARAYLTIPFLNSHLPSLPDLASGVNYKLLASALNSKISSQTPLNSTDMIGRIWLLAYFIYIYKHALGSMFSDHAPDILFVRALSHLLSPVATEIFQRIDVDEENTDPKPLPPFIRNELLSLVNQGSITRLLSHVDVGNVSGTDTDAESEAKYLATYALTLLRIFPRRGDEIRMWLYLGSASTADRGFSSTRIPAIKYFWKATRLTRVYRTVTERTEDILAMLKSSSTNATPGSSNFVRPGREQEWTVIFLFLELYTFLLKVLDDDEFFSVPSCDIGGSPASWTKESTLPLEEVRDLTVFLKNLAFPLYWNLAELTSEGSKDGNLGIRDYFNLNTLQHLPTTEPVVRSTRKELVAVAGVPLEYFRGLVTGLLRMVHERDSRRRFLPEGHWLMTDRFDMEGFIPSVVAEEENRHRLLNEDESDIEDESMEDEYINRSPGLVGTGRAQQLRRIELLRKRQHQAARRKELEAVAPRLEILRNMPFFIPFYTRVQIFREFIYRDQVRRRGGNVDPDFWRFSISQGTEVGQRSEILARHHANIRRGHLFEDAFQQFYPLGEGLKEPIQITFIDQFDTVEAGIDGGGVMKEFLTSIISDAFDPSRVLSFFSENDQHLLYPKPSAVEQRRALLRQAGVSERSATWNEEIRGLLKRYEFLGRIIGKCLYEGILVDVNFAGFFLLKWALTGGSSSASRESAYRANLNDLRDLDESLYQGLLQLKNYTGDVEDFSLNFTVTDTITLPANPPDSQIKTQSITKDLKPDGSKLAVTNQNRLVYISYIARHRLQVQPYLQTNAFLQGMGQIIQPSWLSMFNQVELQRLVGGDATEIDIADLRQNTVYSGVYVLGDDRQEHITIQLFWQVLAAMANSDKQKVLKFVTSTPRAPLLGFSHLNPRFSIRDSTSDEERLPSASTCANLLKLPRYTSAKTLREKLMYAINSGAGFDLS
ncbi:ubiquitin-protein ligase (E3) [Ophidiomyces ophidiicola]|uniref:Ubiquitin-protein ligase (E3) n=1 Tax=Ophidiomyces ophidiicola TaxID=1387563 RepID=A0ACB8V3T2_9EURO|nr:ubiquitin-protein ligase (E3) [Ophidiomyces ophidiicola]KAI1923319.1 ubiquitin-protein ligase (E3) [Ophidiomyces ophidiicola]KAI1930105.1 ubiquitin-protein ligase (E3) [Ophidiomyces ophidiicola]KAI1965086.1 ubiquitin-protein ligase (E3) [Ophidiomyces ophidiicola]KAI1974304.1 ubiquitin-protein ligase (E3) [Ophidiomyces ophidiicola]